jgi:Zn-dependent M28 family amino/carboxypeptidase
MGSYVYAQSLKKNKEEIEGMICLEMIGYFTSEPKSQYYPLPFFSFFYPDRGNFIALVSNLSSKSLLEKVKGAFKKGTDLPVESLATLSVVLGVSLSDHRSFWEHGYKALMVTDTAFLRNVNYHTMLDRPETLDYESMAEVVIGLMAALEEILK